MVRGFPNSAPRDSGPVTIGRMRDRGILWVIGGLGVLFGLAAELVQAAAGAPGEHVLVDLLVGQTYLLGGLFAWSREPRNPTWKLMTAVGFAWYVGTFAVSSIPLVHGFGVVLADTDAIGLAALVLVYPTGRFERASERATVIGGAVALIAGDRTTSKAGLEHAVSFCSADNIEFHAAQALLAAE